MCPMGRTTAQNTKRVPKNGPQQPASRNADCRPDRGLKKGRGCSPRHHRTTTCKPEDVVLLCLAIVYLVTPTAIRRIGPPRRTSDIIACHLQPY
ncbi:hypothetical protein NDU88_008203 [Pleurodeles waltl]|uniref:Uncharacterized protein n=1 Tax=Pleurodeles waltl TaxID=8319 RepID=A0AAV7VRV4_PLEWA|nr:hypothetical protein NDU88_008203 [Pleurodeles waltl]